MSGGGGRRDGTCLVMSLSPFTGCCESQFLILVSVVLTWQANSQKGRSAAWISSACKLLHLRLTIWQDSLLKSIPSTNEASVAPVAPWWHTGFTWWQPHCPWQPSRFTQWFVLCLCPHHCVYKKGRPDEVWRWRPKTSRKSQGVFCLFVFENSKWPHCSFRFLS